jgi:TonB family protein
MIGLGLTGLFRVFSHQEPGSAGVSPITSSPRTFAGYGSGSGCGYRNRRVTTYENWNAPVPANILSRPAAVSTSDARLNGTSGTVRLSAVLDSTGKVTDIQVIDGLPDGLSESAVDAAHQIQFTPAMKDGRAVSQQVQLTYDFEP